MILDLASITLPVTHKLIAKIDPSPISKIHESTHFIHLILNLKHELHRELLKFFRERERERERAGVALWCDRGGELRASKARRWWRVIQRFRILGHRLRDLSHLIFFFLMMWHDTLVFINILIKSVSHVSIFHPSLNHNDHFDTMLKGWGPIWHSWKVRDQFNTSAIGWGPKW